MLIDKQTQLSDAQAVTSTGSTPSSSVIDLGVTPGINLNPTAPSLTSIDRNEPARGSVNYTRFSVQTLIAKKLDVTGRIIYSKAEQNYLFAESFTGRNWNPRIDQGKSAPIDRVQKRGEKEAPKPVPPGSYNGAAIILLTDGQTTTGPDPIESARIASERGVRVFTVGIGTEKGEMIGAEGWSMRVRLDEASLKQIANVTQGEYFYAGTAGDLKKVYETLNSKLVFEQRQTEITALFAAVAALFAVMAAVLSMLWYGRIM